MPVSAAKQPNHTWDLFGTTEAGFYIFPVMDNFGLMAKVETWPRILSYFLGGDELTTWKDLEDFGRLSDWFVKL